jgi:hypothetical protein
LADFIFHTGKKDDLLDLAEPLVLSRNILTTKARSTRRFSYSGRRQPKTLNHWNDWNHLCVATFGTIETAGTFGFERSAAIERLERFEQMFYANMTRAQR